MNVLHEGDCRAILPTLAADSFDSVVTDPPYELGFMGKGWDRTGVAFDVEMWGQVLRVLKPGGYMLAFGGTRTYHRMTCAIEDAGFEVRDCLMWLYGTGFPKGQGRLKPAWEPILLARKPGPRVLPLGIDACRIGTGEDRTSGGATGKRKDAGEGYSGEWADAERGRSRPTGGRYPANVVHDGSDEVMEAFAAFGERSCGAARVTPHDEARADSSQYRTKPVAGSIRSLGDTGTAARFFYCAKASKSERGAANTHPTVKPLALLRWMLRLITPPGGLVLDPFAGSDTTLLAAEAEGVQAVGIEQDAGHCDIIRKRLKL